jgi:hypothetical protein
MDKETHVLVTAVNLSIFVSKGINDPHPFPHKKLLQVLLLSSTIYPQHGQRDSCTHILITYSHMIGMWWQKIKYTLVRRFKYQLVILSLAKNYLSNP